MCGLAGIVDIEAPAQELQQRSQALGELLRHRGPDDQGSWAEDGVALAHRRLSILDLSERGRQPMISGDGRWLVVYNGEIYNHLELRRTLPGSWRTTTDTEVLLRLIEREGVEGISRAVGMFALAAWDRRERTLHLVRDRLGIKPLYFVHDRDTLCFASEAQALARCATTRPKLDRRALMSYLVLGYPPRDRTLFQGVEAVAPAEVVSFDGHALRRRRWWSLPERCDPHLTLDAATEEFSALWPRVVCDHLQSEVPLGLFLSGGLDSAAIAIALQRQGVSLNLYTAAFSDGRFDESAQAGALASQLALPHRRVVVSPLEVDDLLSRLAYHADPPVSDSSLIGTWLLCREAGREVKVALSGDGADEILAGYLTHRATEIVDSPLGPAVRYLSRLMGKTVMPYSEARPDRSQGAARFLRYAHHGVLAHFRWRTLIDPDEMSSLLCTTDAARSADEPNWNLPYPEQPLLNRILAADVEGYLVQDELVRVDRMGMAHALEIRVPFLDHRLVELVFRLPYSCKGGVLSGGKRLLRRWLVRVGYADVARRRKRGFQHPLAQWFHGRLGDRLRLRLADAALAPLFRRTMIEAWLASHRARQEDRSFELWNILFLLEWGEQHRVQL